MVDAISIALSGLRAQSQRLGVAATNIANVSTSGPVPEDGVTPPPGAPKVYIPLEVQQSSLVAGEEGAGTTTSVSERDPGYTVIYDPNSVFANDEGLIAVPEVDLASEIVDMLLAKNIFKANLATIWTAEEMQDEALDLIV